MSLGAGIRLGPYEILASLGAGGMGEVYRARDTRLGRDVAIKVLPPEVARDADRRARFEREARAVAALSHPNILAIHDIGTEGDQIYVVTELLEGETLAARLAEGALPVRKAVEVAVAIARGLSAAHGKGIAHRDLKPANVFLLADGQVKLLDFGLAKTGATGASGAMGAAGAVPSASGAVGAIGATETQLALTDPGMVMGTVGYMAPEQVRNQAVDGRADLFALGVVLYEMLTGQRAFARESAVESLNAILKEDPPDLAAARPDLPPSLDRIVRHCLEKNPAERFQSARDAIFALESLTGGVTSSAARAAVPVAPRRILTSERVAWALAALVTMGLIASLLQSRVPAPAVGAATFVGVGAPFHRFHLHAAPVISPDGLTLAFWAPDADGQVKLWVRNLHSPQARALPDTVVTNLAEDGMQPSFSPDGRHLLVFLDGKLKRVALDGGTPQTLADAPAGRSASWGVTDQVVYQPSVGGPLFVIPASGGTPRPLPEASPPDDRPRAGPRHPFFLPDGKHFLFNNLETIYVASIEGGPAREIVRVASRAEYANGRLLYVKDGSLMAHPFDPVSLAVSGEPVRVAEKVGAGLTSTIDFAFSASMNGTLAYWEGRPPPLSELVWVDRSGRRVGTLGQPAHYFGMSASADLSRLAFEAIDLQSNWYASHVLDALRGGSTRIPLDRIDRVSALTPILSRDGRRVWFSAAPGIFRLDAGREVPELVGVNQGVVWITDVSPDGHWLFYVAAGSSTTRDIWLLPLTGDPTPKPWLQSPASDDFARFSPDGKWAAYMQREADGSAVYLDAFPARGQRQRVSPGFGHWPMWSSDGRRLYYLTPEQHMMEVQVSATADGLAVSPPVDLFVAPTPNGGFTRIQYWPAPDGRFLVNARLDAAMPRTINVVFNWPALID